MSDSHINSIESKSIEDVGTRARDPHRKAGGSDPAERTRALRSAREQRVNADLVLRELRAHNFVVLSTVDENEAPDSAGVNYGVSAPGGDLALYVMTRRHLKKARNIARNPHVSLVVPLPHRLLRFIPPATIQLRGRAEILDWNDEEGTNAFRRFWMGRRILASYEKSRRRQGETRVCFLKITLDPVIRTYSVGYSVWDLWRRMESAGAKVLILPEQQASRPEVTDATKSPAP
jgi:nitroimidazol reductase NimA-like FMN-containing flavoprotein (pyridoxamine 5'-phosphate oxidase superfamily)